MQDGRDRRILECPLCRESVAIPTSTPVGARAQCALCDGIFRVPGPGSADASAQNSSGIFDRKAILRQSTFFERPRAGVERAPSGSRISTTEAVRPAATRGGQSS
ncbi:MAG: hypothetical protein IV100_20690 [Myxococcales bacterium]|nr:hypothetical protein [Myxococcales bacterium]